MHAYNARVQWVTLISGFNEIAILLRGGGPHVQFMQCTTCMYMYYMYCGFVGAV